MQHGPGQIKYRLERRLGGGVQPLRARGDQCSRVKVDLRGRLRESCALLIEHCAQGFYDERTAVSRNQGIDGFELEQPIDRRYRATRGSGGIQHGG
jgi:hypothetical protein